LYILVSRKQIILQYVNSIHFGLSQWAKIVCKHFVEDRSTGVPTKKTNSQIEKESSGEDFFKLLDIQKKKAVHRQNVTIPKQSQDAVNNKDWNPFEEKDVEKEIQSTNQSGFFFADDDFAQIGTGQSCTTQFEGFFSSGEESFTTFGSVQPNQNSGQFQGFFSDDSSQTNTAGDCVQNPTPFLEGFFSEGDSFSAAKQNPSNFQGFFGAQNDDFAKIGEHASQNTAQFQGFFTTDIL